MVNNRVEGLFQNKGELTTREKIMDVAIDLISRKGFEAVSVRDIARGVGIRESAIYNHFESKDEILDRITEYFMAELTESDPLEMPMDVMLEKYGPEGYMSIAARAYLQNLNKPQLVKIWRIIAIELYRNEKIRTFFRTTMVKVPVDAWEQSFKRMMELGYIKEGDARALAREFVYYCLYLFFDYFVVNFDGSTYDRFTESLLKDLAPHIKFMMDSVKVTQGP